MTLLRATDANVVARVGPAAATAVRDQQVIPAIVINHDRGFAVDRDVAGLFIGVEALARLGIKLHQPDVAEIGAVYEPQPLGIGIKKDARINRIAVLDPVRGGHYAALFPFVVRGIRIEGFVREQVDVRLRWTAVGGDIQKVAVANVNDVRSQSASREPSALPPSPTVIGDE